MLEQLFAGGGGHFALAVAGAAINGVLERFQKWWQSYSSKDQAKIEIISKIYYAYLTHTYVALKSRSLQYLNLKKTSVSFDSNSHLAGSNALANRFQIRLNKTLCEI